MQRASKPVGGSGSNTDVELLDVGEYEGRLVYVADLGMHKKEYKGDYKGDFTMISLGVEVLGKTVSWEDDDGVTHTRPMVMWTKPCYVYDTLTEKGIEYQLYSVFDPSAEEGEIPAWEKQLGKPCNINVTHKAGSGDHAGKVYANIGSLTPIPLKYQGSVPAAETVEMGLGDSLEENNHVNKALYGLPRWLFDNRITDSSSPMQDDDVPY